ncbi:MAG: helix-turn-helix transcriptional regulator [Desulfuromonadales bacterium]
MHRFRSAHVLDDPLTKPKGFILEKYLQDGVMGIPVENQAKKVTLTALFEPEAAYHLLESKLSVDQQATTQHDGRLLIKATVNDTYQLRWWLLGFGAQVEILTPKSLRTEFACTAQAMNGMYQQGEPM